MVRHYKKIINSLVELLAKSLEDGGKNSVQIRKNQAYPTDIFVWVLFKKYADVWKDRIIDPLQPKVFGVKFSLREI